MSLVDEFVNDKNMRIYWFILVLLVLPSPVSAVFATSCSYKNSGLSTTVLVNAQIYGSDPSTSYGSGTVNVQGGNFCIGMDLYEGMIVSSKGYGIWFLVSVLEFPKSYSFSSGQAGSWVISCIDVNYCDGTTAGVKAYPNGVCMY